MIRLNPSYLPAFSSSCGIAATIIWRDSDTDVMVIDDLGWRRTCLLLKLLIVIITPVAALIGTVAY